MLLAVISESCCQHSPAGTPTAASSAQLSSPTVLSFIPAPSTERKPEIKVFRGQDFFSFLITAEQGRTLHWHNFRLCTGERRETTSLSQQSCCSGEISRHLLHTGQMANQGEGQLDCAPRQQPSEAAKQLMWGSCQRKHQNLQPWLQTLQTFDSGHPNLEFSCY